MTDEQGETFVWADGTIYDPLIRGHREATADELRRNVPGPHRHACSENGCPGAECYRGRIDGCGHPSKSATDPDGGGCPWGAVPCPGEGRP